MSTNDPFSTTPQQPDSPQQGSAWQPGPMPEPDQPDVRTYDYGAQGYAAPQPPQGGARGFSGGEPAPQYGASQYGAPQYGAPQYGAPSPYYGAPAPAPTSTDGVSIGALITGILGLTLIPVVLGIVGLRRTAGGIRKGRGMAIAGLILGIVSTIAWAIAIYFIVALVQNEDFQEGFQSEFESDPFTSGETYGDDPALDALWDQCEVGDDVACDDLYWGSPIGSGYEEFGRTCGGRSEQLFGGRCDE